MKPAANSTGHSGIASRKVTACTPTSSGAPASPTPSTQCSQASSVPYACPLATHQTTVMSSESSSVEQSSHASQNNRLVGMGCLDAWSLSATRNVQGESLLHASDGVQHPRS
eukprot:scaffold84261_cov75-Phaeocystis_antarctica.AAC.4